MDHENREFGEDIDVAFIESNLEQEQQTDEEASVRQYGLRSPIQNEELVMAQMRAGHRYQNNLIALERCKRQVYRDLRSKYVNAIKPFEDRVETLRADLASLREAINAERAEARRRVVVKTLNDRAKGVRQELREASEELKRAREDAKEDPIFKEKAKELDERATKWAKALRATTEAWWGTYLLIEGAMKQAKKGKMDPKFRPWRGEGRIGVQIQGGMSVEELFSGQHTMLRVEPLPPEATTASTRSGRKRASRTRLWIRIDSDDRAPIWAIFPLWLHRPIPPDALIKGAMVCLRRIGTKQRWKVNFIFTHHPVKPAQRAGTVALDLGWRKRPDATLRVAYWVDDAGEHGELTMPASIRGRLRKADELREIQDRLRNHAILRLRQWVRVWHAQGKELPEFISKVLPYLRSQRRLTALVFTWSGQRFQGDEQIYAFLEKRRRKARHLYQWESHSRANALYARRQVYRLAAKKLALKYGTVILEKFDLAKVKQHPTPEEEAEPMHKAQRAQLHASAPGEFRTTIQNAVHREGGLVVPLAAMDTTVQCHSCKSKCKWDRAEELWHTCEHCGALWDQDHNAARNLLARFLAQPRDPTTPNNARES